MKPFILCCVLGVQMAPMRPEPPPRPTDAELDILRVLWRDGASTVKHLQDALAAEGRVSGASVLKLLQIMEGKDLVRRDASQRAHIFVAVLEEALAQQALTGDLADRVFGGSAARLAMRALAARPSSPEELDEIEEMIARFHQDHEERS